MEGGVGSWSTNKERKEFLESGKGNCIEDVGGLLGSSNGL